jgi:hypothetical protein
MCRGCNASTGLCSRKMVAICRCPWSSAFVLADSFFRLTISGRRSKNPTLRNFSHRYLATLRGNAALFLSYSIIAMRLPLEMFTMKRITLICAALAWTCTTMVALAQENPHVGEKHSAKHANVHRFHHAAHYSLNSEHHHRAMAAGQASIVSHPSHPAYHGPHHHYHY